MEFRLLGPVTADVDGKQVRLGEPLHQLFLAILLLADGRPVSKDALVDRIWGENPPSKPQNRLRNIAAEVRVFLAEGEPGADSLLPRSSGGYRMQVDHQRVDLWRFRKGCSQATQRTKSEPVEALQHIRAGLDEWNRSPTDSSEPEPLFRLQGDWINDIRRGLQEEYRRAMSDCARLELGVGEHSQALARLEALSGLDPCDEQVAELLMRAYHLVGRTADALRVFQQLRKELDKELGIEPGLALVQLQQRVLKDDPALRRTATGPPTVTTEEPVTNPESIQPPDKGAKSLARSAAQLVVATARDRSADHAGAPAGDLIHLLRKEFGGDDRATATLTRVLSTPGDVEAVRQLRQILAVCMGNDQSFRQDVERLVDDEPALAKGGIFAEKVRNAAVYNEKVVINRGGFRIGG